MTRLASFIAGAAIAVSAFVWGLVWSGMASAAPRVLSVNGLSLFLFDGPCQSQFVISRTRPEFIPDLRNALFKSSKGMVPGCYVEADGIVFVLLETGEAEAFESRDFKEVRAGSVHAAALYY